MILSPNGQSDSITFVPQPNKKPVASVVATEVHELGAGGYSGIKDGTKRETGITLDNNPATMGMLSQLGRNIDPDRSEEIPNTAPL